MIDLHCHILPGIDDGAENIDASIAMAEKRFNKGSHIFYAHPIIIMENTAMKITSHFSSRFVTSRIRERQLPLTLLEGQEVRITGTLIEDIDRDEIYLQI